MLAFPVPVLVVGGQEDAGLRWPVCHPFIPSEFAPNKQMFWACCCDLDELRDEIGGLRTISSHPWLNGQGKFPEMDITDTMCFSSFIIY